MGKNGVFKRLALYLSFWRAHDIEMLNAAEQIKVLVHNDVDLWHRSGRILGVVNEEGVGVIEAPRGTLIHHYKVDKSGKILKVNLIVSTGHNNLAMNREVFDVAREYIKDGKATEGISTASRLPFAAMTPASLAPRMPLVICLLELTIHEADGTVRETLRR